MCVLAGKVRKGRGIPRKEEWYRYSCGTRPAIGLRWSHQTQREPVEITWHGRRELMLMSAGHYDWLVAAARRTHRTSEAVAVVADAIVRAEMDPEQASLDNLLT